jgi:hypothetical protein
MDLTVRQDLLAVPAERLKKAIKRVARGQAPTPPETGQPSRICAG